MLNKEYTVQASWLLPIEGDVLESGWMLVREGRIADLGSGSAPKVRGPHFSYPDAVLIPALVNAHTHLACQFLKDGDRDLDFSAWLQSGVAPRVISAARDHPEVLYQGAERAVEELLHGGVGTVADGFFHPAGREALRAAGLRGVFFREQFGAMAEDLDRYCEAACEQIAADANEPASLIAAGVAPHAPYTCPPKVLKAVAKQARAMGLRMSLHLAESPAESEFFERSSGPLFDAFATGERKARYRFGVSPVETLDAMGVLGPDLIAVHAVQLSPVDIQILARTQTPVVHCPSSNLSLSVGIAPLLELRDAGVCCALGTDSGASVGKLDMFEEMRLAILSQRGRRRPASDQSNRTRFGAAEVLEMATLKGAEVLGMDKEIGSLGRGKAADFAIVDQSKARHRDFRDPSEALVWASTPDDVLALAVGGNFLFGDSSS